MAKKLWEHDVHVKTFGRGNRILQFTGGMFASNRGIKMVQKMLKNTPEMLRFKQIRYKWIKSARDYTYFRINSPSDAAPYKD